MLYIAWLVIAGSVITMAASYVYLVKAITDLNSISVDHQRVRVSFFTHMVALCVAFICFCLVKLEQTDNEIKSKLKNQVQHLEDE